MSVERYKELLDRLVAERERHGGSLPVWLESRLVEDLDRCWWELTVAEQDEIERAGYGRWPR